VGWGFVVGGVGFLVGDGAFSVFLRRNLNSPLGDPHGTFVLPLSPPSYPSCGFFFSGVLSANGI